MKGPVRREETKKEKDRRSKPKGNSLKTEFFNTLEEARAACKNRKRKERQESVSSISQERKVIRSSSEERPTTRKLKENDIRRVSSSENFKNEEEQVVENTKKSSENVILDLNEECEHEKRRSHERFWKPLTLKCRKYYSNKKAKSRNFYRTKFIYSEKNKDYVAVRSDVFHDKKEAPGECTQYIEDKLANLLQLNVNPEPERTPSPVETCSPHIDLSTLHQQVDDDSEPIPSCSIRYGGDAIEAHQPTLSQTSNRLLSSPRNSIIATHSGHLDDTLLYASVRKTLNPIDQRIQKLSKQINDIKKKIKKFENDFCAEHGYKPNHLDKTKDSAVKQWYFELNKLKKEHRRLQDPTASPLSKFEERQVHAVRCTRGLRNTLLEIETKLTSKRESCHRTDIIEEMNDEEVIEEKVAVQKALLHLESLYGRPSDREDRDLVRPLYDRYRILKRMVSKGLLGNANSNDLETIHEDETINFLVDPKNLSEATTDQSSSISVVGSDNSDNEACVNDNFHSMSRHELLRQYNLVLEEKKVLKRTIKEYEDDIQMGKVAPRINEAISIQQIYKDYKRAKGKLRLLDALISKENI